LKIGTAHTQSSTSGAQKWGSFRKLAYASAIPARRTHLYKTGTGAKCADGHLYAQQRGYAQPLSIHLEAFDCSADIARIVRMMLKAGPLSSQLAASSSKKAVQE